MLLATQHVRLEGNPEFAVGFRDHLYLFADDQNARRFCENPDPFIQKPPRSSCVAIVGHRFAGRIAVARYLALDPGREVVLASGELLINAVCALTNSSVLVCISRYKG